MPILKLEIGALAPDFKLIDQDSETILLSDYRGQRVMLYFFWKIGSLRSAERLREVQWQLESIQNQGFAFLGISSEEPEKLLDFSEKEFIGFPLLSDRQNEVAKAYGVWGPKSFLGKTFEGVRRTVFLIDKQGKITNILDDLQFDSKGKLLLIKEGHSG